MDKFEIKLNDLEDKVHDIDKSVNTLSSKVDELRNDREECSDACNSRMNRMEQSFNSQITTVVNNNQKITYALLGIVAALAGAEAVIKGLGNTPAVAEVGYYSSVFYFLMLSLYIFYKALKDKKTNLILLAAAVVLIFTAVIRINLGFLEAGTTNMEFAVGSMLGSIICLIDGVRRWTHRG